MQQSHAPHQGFLHAPHETENLRAGHPEIAGVMMLVNVYLDVGEQLRCVLHLIDQHRRFMKLEEQGGVVFCNIPLVEIIQCYILPPDLLFFRQLPQHRRFARLTGTGQQDSGIRFAQFQNPAFHVPSDILHHTPPHDFGRFLVQFYYNRR